VKPHSRNLRRAYDKDGNEIAPMPLSNMRGLGTRAVLASWEACSHEAIVPADRFPDELPVPDVGLRLRCSACGSRQIKTVPYWRMT
jgi:hypothetical protein